MSKISFNVVPQFGEKPTPSKIFKYDQKWEKIPYESFKEFKVEDLVQAKFRFIIEFQLWKERCRIVTHYEDYDAIKLKYPKELVIHLGQIIELFKGLIEPPHFLTILQAVGVLDASVKK